MAVQTAGMAWQLHCCQGAFQDVRSLSGWTASCSSTWNSSSPSAAFVLRRCRQHKRGLSIAWSWSLTTIPAGVRSLSPEIPPSRCVGVRSAGADSANAASTEAETAGVETASGGMKESDTEEVVGLALTEEEIKKAEAKKRMEKIKQEQAKKAREQALKVEEAKRLFKIGQDAYGKGVYDQSLKILQMALELIPKGSELGGEIQIWVAMALDANGRYNECILLYKTLEAKHPAKNIRRQAMDLRFILEAPKLKISKDEMVSIPIIDADPNSSVAGKKSWTQTARERQSRARMMRAKIYDPLDDILNFKKPPTWQENPYVYVAFSVWSTLVIISLVFGNRH